ncbi:MAG: protein kinase [Micromonosporaceae bacterium]|nr:protein kinase [Micromonosporaceae bacterium]
MASGLPGLLRRTREGLVFAIRERVVRAEGGGVDERSTTRPLPPGTVPLTEGDPRRVGDYHLLARLSAGETPSAGAASAGAASAGAASVTATAYLARASLTAPPAVLKIARSRPAGGNRLRRNFVDVAGIRMPTRYVAKVIGKGSHEGLAYLIREYVDGMTLAQLVAEDGKLDPTTLNSFAVSTAAAICAVHAAGQVHGNLKPTNVMVTLAGVRLLDHGLARQSGQPRPQPAEDVLGWARMIMYAGTGRHPVAPMIPIARRLPEVETLERPVALLAERALSPDPDERPSMKSILLGLVSPADGGRPTQRWRRHKSGDAATR